ncbi:MAG: energy transducer TonB [Planctomycetota bacterium]|jgi:TonB family protein
MSLPPPTDVPASAPRARVGRRAATRAAKRGAWAGSAVLSLTVHAGALGVVGLLALVPRMVGSETETAGVRLPWAEAFAEVAEADPWEFVPVPAESPELETPIVEVEPELAPMPLSEPPPPRVEQLPDDPQVDPLPPTPAPQPVAEEAAEAEESTEPAEDPEPTEPQPDGEALPEGQAPDLGGDSEPVLEHAPTPKYPRLARARGWEGVVEVRITVAADGTVSDVQVETSSGRTLLDDAALEAVRQWRFTPGRVAGLAAERVVLHRVHFALAE